MRGTADGVGPRTVGTPPLCNGRYAVFTTRCTSFSVGLRATVRLNALLGSVRLDGLDLKRMAGVTYTMRSERVFGALVPSWSLALVWAFPTHIIAAAFVSLGA